MANGENLCDEVRSLGKRQSGDRQTEWYPGPGRAVLALWRVICYSRKWQRANIPSAY